MDKVGELSAFGRSKSYPDALKDIHWISGDFTNPSSLATAVAGCDTVFHLVTATTPVSSNMDKIGDVQSNVVSTLHLLEACREKQVRRIIFISSGGTIYGMPEQIPTSENTPLNPITAYGISKMAIEKYLTLYEYLYGIECRVLRVANPYGPYQSAVRNQGVVAAFLARALEGKPVEIWGNGSIIRDYIYVNDVVEALELAAVHNGPSRTFNIGSGQGHSIHEIVKAIEKVLELSIEVQQFDGRKVDVPVSILDISLAANELLWRPRTSLLNGLTQTSNWMREIIRR
jgi:UDP-glucose 4-epimerase